MTSTSFLGTGWSFPPKFVPEVGGVLMTSDEADIEASLRILLSTGTGERDFQPKYGLNLHEMLFESLSTTATTFLKDRIKTAILIFEPRINLLRLHLDTTSQYEGRISIEVDYEVRATNSRYNLVYPFYLHDGNEVKQTVQPTTAKSPNDDSGSDGSL